MDRFYNEYLRDLSFKKSSDKVNQIYALGGGVQPLDATGDEKPMPAKSDTIPAVKSGEQTDNWFQSLGSSTQEGVINVFETIKNKVTGALTDTPKTINVGDTHIADNGVKMRLIGNGDWIPDNSGSEIDSLEVNKLADQYNNYITENTVMHKGQQVFPELHQRNQALKLFQEYNEKAPESFKEEDVYNNNGGRATIPLAQRFDMDEKGTIEDLQPGETWYQGKITKKLQKRKEEEILKIDPIELQELPVNTDKPVLEKAGEAPEYTASTVDEDFSESFHHRKYKKENGKYSMFNPIIGKWKPITRKTYNFGIKQSAYNEDTELHERWWSKDGSKDKSITSGSVLEYLQKKEYGGEPQDNMGDQYFRNKVDLADVVKTQSTQEEAPAIKVNKKGWVDAEHYKENTSIKGITNDNKLLVKVMNQDLVNSQLNNYKNSNFTEDNFLNQIYKESAGDNSVVSPAGAMGVAQFTPETFLWAKEKGWIPETAKITDEAAGSLAQRKYMDHLYNDIAVVRSAGENKKERQARSFASYNMGPTKFTRFWGTLTDKEKEGGYMEWYKALDGRDKDHPTETRTYTLWNMNKGELENKFPKAYFNANWLFDKWKATNPKYRYK